MPRKPQQVHGGGLPFPGAGDVDLRSMRGHPRKVALNTRMLYRTKPCKFFLAGQCTRGEACVFAHEKEDLRPQPDMYRTSLCPAILKMGKCGKEDRCQFAHSVDELRKRPPQQLVSSPMVCRCYGVCHCAAGLSKLIVDRALGSFESSFGWPDPLGVGAASSHDSDQESPASRAASHAMSDPSVYGTGLLVGVKNTFLNFLTEEEEVEAVTLRRASNRRYKTMPSGALRSFDVERMDPQWVYTGSLSPHMSDVETPMSPSGLPSVSDNALPSTGFVVGVKNTFLNCLTEEEEEEMEMWRRTSGSRYKTLPPESFETCNPKLRAPNDEQ